MTHRCQFLSLLSSATLLLSAATFAAGPNDGFRGLRWGSEPTSTMQKVDRKANMDRYVIQNDDKRVVGTEAASIHYLFYGGGLCRIEVKWWPQANNTYSRIRAGLTEVWGPPTKADESARLHMLEWISSNERTGGQLLAMEDAKTPELDWWLTLIIQERACSKSAIEGKGL